MNTPGWAIFLSATLIVSSAVELDYLCIHKASWLRNRDNNVNIYLQLRTDIIGTSSIDSPSTYRIEAYGVPSYSTRISSADITALNSRPNSLTDFTTGHTSVSPGQDIEFAQDVGYVTGNRGTCNGYWPPVTNSSINNLYGCPKSYYLNDLSTQQFSLNPAPEIGHYRYKWTEQYIFGRAVNGIILLSGLSNLGYDLSGWNLLAPEYSKYETDICNGQALNTGVYYHNSYSTCLKDATNDTTSDHSPIYGFAVDGYPIYGPYQSAGVLAIPCWQLRDYSPSSLTGCSTGRRTCTLYDMYDYTQGTIQTSKSGLGFSSTITTQNGNTIIAKNGIYLEDYFYNSTCSGLGEQYLDEFNGHSHGSYGYHYHMTIDSSNKPRFPYVTGPSLYGCISTNSESECGKSYGVSYDQSQCSKKTKASSNVIRLLLVIFVVLILLVLILVAGYFVVSCMRRLRRLVPIGNDTTANDDLGNLPEAEATTVPKSYPVSIIGYELINTASAVEAAGSAEPKLPIATATAVTSRYEV